MLQYTMPPVLHHSTSKSLARAASVVNVPILNALNDTIVQHDRRATSLSVATNAHAQYINLSMSKAGLHVQLLGVMGLFA